MNSTEQSQWGWLELFIPLLFLLNGLLLFPGTQPFRFAIRATPYLASLASLALFRRNGRMPLAPGGFAMQLVLVLLVLNLFHPQTQIRAGLAQFFLQLAILAPAFWAAGLVTGERRLIRLLWIFWAVNVAGVAVGLLQIYFPDRFLPAEFSAGASASWLRSLTFISPSGRVLLRPPGLSDLPGGAALAGSLSAILGFAFSALRSTVIWVRLVCFASALAGFAVLYLTQVRSLTLMTLFGILLLLFFGLRAGLIWNRVWMAAAAVILLAGSFTWAVAVGGGQVRDRFLQIGNQGMAASYDASRGWFWRYTFGPGLSQYPLGAGPGRWGMMGAYFSDPHRPDSPALWAEIQPTGWLYDGGVPMWLLYGCGLGASMLFLFRVARSYRYGTTVPFAAALTFCLNSSVIGASLSGPAFNTTMGLQYWLLTALVYGAARQTWQGPALAPVCP